MNRKQFWGGVLAIVIVLVFLVVVNKVGAEDEYAKGVQVFQVADHTCVLWKVAGSGTRAGDLECFCPCEDDCNIENVIVQENVTEKDKPKPTDKPDPPKPTPKPTDKPDPIPKKKCNCGGGNLGEGCNPNPNCDTKKNDKQDE